MGDFKPIANKKIRYDATKWNKDNLFTPKPRKIISIDAIDERTVKWCKGSFANGFFSTGNMVNIPQRRKTC